ncbi:MAG: DNA translocase FtsK, partial [Ardenticatenales bacterium]|nr:DNA translocase FtsK [Ardenticatenales bacterium]
PPPPTTPVAAKAESTSATRPPVTRSVAPAPLPPLDLLHHRTTSTLDPSIAREKARIIEETLRSFGVVATVVQVNQGPAVTQFGVQPGFIEQTMRDGTVRKRKVKVNAITSLADDLALALAAKSIRVEAPVPGRPYVGIEVPNIDTELVTLHSVLTSAEFKKTDSDLAFALGRDVSGHPVVGDLARMPHMLIAGATGSGKSVCVNTIIASLLFNLGPEQLQILMIDPKMVELIPYNGIPHLIAPVVTDMERVVGALTWAMREMDRRYKLFSKAGKRNHQSYNSWALTQGKETLPYIVIIIDELADLMMVAADQVERIICRIAQMARATGMHLILATQRPSVDVVTGLIKANVPARVAFAVASQVDSRVILDTNGAEALLGRGDMLFQAPDSSKLQRLQGCFVSDQELQEVVGYWLRYNPQRAAAPVDKTPWDDILDEMEEAEAGEDDLLEQAIAIVKEHQWASTSFLQRKLRIGYTRAARLIDTLEEKGIIGPPEEGNNGSRTVLVGAAAGEKRLSE